MNAKDLAALAALGMGGAYLYNRSKKSDDEVPAASPKSRDFDAVEPETELGTKGAYMPNTPEFQTKGAYLPETSAAQDMGTEGNRTSMAVGPAAKKPVARPAARPTTPVAAPEAPAGNPKLNSLRETKPRNFDPALYSSEIMAQRGQKSLNKQLNDNKAEKKAAATAASQAIIDRMSRRTRPYMTDEAGNNMKRGGAVKKMASGGSVSSASSRADGIAQRGKTRGKMC